MKILKFIAIIFPLVIISYNNCGESAFRAIQSTHSSPPPRRNSLGVLINNNDKYTTEFSVNLTLSPPDTTANEMLIGFDPHCSSGTWEALTTTKPIELNQPNRTNTVYVKYRYLGENESPCMSDSIIHDNIPPTVQFENQPSSWVKETSLRIGIDVEDSGSGIQSTECDKQGHGQFGTCGSEMTYDSLVENQNYVLVVKAKDRAGNSSNPKHIHWRVDQTAPTLTLGIGPSSVTSDISPDFIFIPIDTGSGIARLECRLNSETQFSTCQTEFSLNNLSDGSHSIEVRAVDNVGLVSRSVSHSWRQDTTAPTIDFTEKPLVITKEQRATFRFSGINSNQGIVSYECQLDRGARQACGSPRTLTGLSSGQHSFSVVGLDSAGNMSSPITYIWLIDTRRPGLTLVEKPEAATRSMEARFVFQAESHGSGIRGIQCKLDSGTYGRCESPKIFNNLSEGTHTLMARSVDQAGNFSDVILYPWIIDRTFPTVRITSKPENPTDSSDASFLFTAQDSESGIGRVVCRLDGGSFEICQGSKNYTNLSKGDHSFSVRARDRAGNLSSVVNYSWSIDPESSSIRLVCSESSAISENTPYQVELATTLNENEETNGTLFIKSRGDIVVRNMEGVVLPSSDGQVTEEIVNHGGVVRKNNSIEVYTPCEGSKQKSVRVYFRSPRNYICKNNTLNQRNYQLRVSVQNHSENEDIEVKIIRYGSNPMNFSRYDSSENGQAIDYILCANGAINPDHCTNLDKSYRENRRGNEVNHVPGGLNFICEDITYSPQAICPLNQGVQGTNRIELTKDLVKDAPWSRLEQASLTGNQSLERSYPLGLDQYDPNFYLELRVTNLNNNRCGRKPLIIKSFALKRHRVRRLYSGVVLTKIGQRKLNTTQINQIVESLKEVGVKRLRTNIRGFYDVIGLNWNQRKWSREQTLEFLKISNREGIKTDLRIHPAVEDYLYADRAYYRPWHHKGFFSTLDVWGQDPPDLNSDPLKVVPALTHWNSEVITVNGREQTRLFKNCGHTPPSIRKINIGRYKARLTKWLNAIKEQGINISLLGVLNEQNWTCFNADIITHSATSPQSLDSLPSNVREELSRQAGQWQEESTSNYARIVKATLEVLDTLELGHIPVESFPSSIGKRTVERMDKISRTPVPMAGHIHTCAFINKMKKLQYKGKSVFNHLSAVSFNTYPAITPEDDVRIKTKEQLEAIVGYFKRCTSDKPLSISEFGYHQKFYRSTSGEEREIRNSQQRYDSYRSFVELVQENKEWNIERVSLFSWNFFRNPISMRIKKSDGWTYPSDAVFPEAEIMRYSH